MLEVGAFEAKNTLGSLLHRVERGEEVLITRHGKPVAQLVAPQTARHEEQAAEAAYARIRRRAAELKLGAFDWEECKKDRDAGHP